MSKKNKLSKFTENKTFPHFFEPTLYYDNIEDFKLKSKWNSDFFSNDNPICLELGCGKGEYSVYMARKETDKNFIGIDIKGARMWRGAKDAMNYELKNIAFIRTRVEFTPLCFAKNEIDEIWITFPDPQLGPKNRIKKRLTSPRFLSYYQNFLKDNAFVNLKTDDSTLYNYTKQVLLVNNLEILIDTDNLYKSAHYDDVLQIKTHYEKLWNSQRTIKYLKFRLPSDVELVAPENED